MTESLLPGGPVAGVIFDMDGTLTDSESLTDTAILDMLDELGQSSDGLDCRRFHGISWKRIDAELKGRFPALADRDLAADIERRFYHLLVTEPPELIPGARDAFVSCAGLVPTGIATGSTSEAVEHLLDRAKLRAACAAYTSADMYENSKPDPECFLMTAEKLSVDPQQCLVFEDSHVGLLAAKAAGMRAVAITSAGAEPLPQVAKTADFCVADYTELPADFFERLAGNE